MNIKVMRNIHLYLGVFFTPLLVLFLITGCWQVFGFHKSSKQAGGYKAPQILQSFSQVHTDQRWTDQNNRPEPSTAFSYLIVVMSLGLLVTTILGVVMAFKYTKPWIVWVCLLMGVLLPSFLLWMARGYK